MLWYPTQLFSTFSAVSCQAVLGKPSKLKNGETLDWVKIGNPNGVGPFFVTLDFLKMG